MAAGDWRLEGNWIKDYSYAFWCPCDFDARPTHGDCRGSNMYDPVFAPIRFEFELEARRATVAMPGVIEAENEPIKNPVTGAPHRIRVVIPEGFGHHRAEVSSARIASTGVIKFTVSQGHGSLAAVVQTPQGVAA